jgi:hydroxyethylthiazole kinase-like uncharacterized protein yjeF
VRPVLSPAESAALDRESQARGISVESLMENAGRAVGRAAGAVVGGLYGKRAVVVCGKGNNGGDGMVAARWLARRGMRAMVLLLADPGSLKDPTATNLRRLSDEGVSVREPTAEALGRELERADVAIDALFGTGFRGAPDGEAAVIISALNDSDVPVVAVDIPSGVNGETGAVAGPAVAAEVTVTFGAAKPGLLLFPGAGYAGSVEVVNIGFPDDLLQSDLWLVEEEDVAALLPTRRPADEKRSTGVVLVIGGSRGMTGAVRLMALAAYRAGAGLVSVATPESVVPVVQSGLAEATFVPLPQTDEGTIAIDALALLEDRLESLDAVALGPGLTRNDETAGFVRAFVASCPVPLVLDADGLNAFAGRAHELADRRSDAVLTPHAGEFGRLSGLSPPEVTQDRLGHSRKLAGEVHAVVALKGNPMLVVSPDGEAHINSTGGPALATAGSGDVLTGTVAALLSRGLAPVDAATAAAYLHGLAGDLAEVDLGEGTVAGDVLARLPLAAMIVKDEA